MMAAILVFFPVMINVTRGLTQVEPAALELMRSYAASEWTVLRKVRIPNALPFFFTALKVGATLALIGAIVGEYFGGASLRPRPDHRPERERAALRRDVGRGPRWRQRPASCSTSRSRRRAGRHPVARVGPRASERVRTGRRRPSDRIGRRPSETILARAARGEEFEHESRSILAWWSSRVVLLPHAARPSVGACRRSAPHARPSRRRTGASVAVDAEAHGPAPAAVGAAGPVRRLLRGGRAGLLRGRGPDGGDARPAARTSSRRRSARGRTGPSSRSRGCPKVLEAREAGVRPRRHRPDLPALRHAVGLVEGQRTSPSPRSSRARRSASGTSATSTRSPPACGLRPASSRRRPTTTEGHPAVQHGSCSCPSEIDVAEAMIYNEYAQVLEATNPATGELYKPNDLNVINWNDYRDAMLQDAIFARAGVAGRGRTTRTSRSRFLRASFKGWIYCRDNPDDCIQYTVDAGSQLRQPGTRRWMMNEINPLIWPSPNGIGIMDPPNGSQTIDIALEPASSRRPRLPRPSERPRRRRPRRDHRGHQGRRASRRARSGSPRAATSRRPIAIVEGPAREGRPF